LAYDAAFAVPVLEHKRRVRIPDPEEPPMPRPRRSPVLAVGLGAWLASVAFAWGVNAGTIPVGRWLDEGSAETPVRSEPRRARRDLLAEAPTPRAATRPAELPPLAPTPPSDETPRVEALPLPTETPSEVAERPAGAEPPPTAPEPAVAARAPEVEEPKAEAAETPPAKAPPSPAVEDRGPGASDGTSCEAAAARYREEIAIGSGAKAPKDLSAEDYAKVLNRGGYLDGCGVPDSARVDVCAAVQNGRAVGVTVRITPRAPGAERCVARKVRSLAFPSHPKLDVARTRFE